MNGLEFQECIKHLYCMGKREFIKTWGDETGSYLWDKFTRPESEDGFGKDVGSFLCYLDMGNMNTLMKEFNSHLDRFREHLHKHESLFKFIQKKSEE